MKKKFVKILTLAMSIIIATSTNVTNVKAEENPNPNMSASAFEYWRIKSPEEFVVPTAEPNIMAKSPAFFKFSDLIALHNAKAAYKAGNTLESTPGQIVFDFKELDFLEPYYDAFYEKGKTLYDTGLNYSTKRVSGDFRFIFPDVLTGRLYDGGFIEMPTNMSRYDLEEYFDKIYYTFTERTDDLFEYYYCESYDDGILKDSGPDRNLGAIYFEDALTGEVTCIAETQGQTRFFSSPSKYDIYHYNLEEPEKLFASGHMGNIYLRFTPFMGIDWANNSYEVIDTYYIRLTVMPITN